MYFDRTHISDDELRAFYKALLYPRLVEEKMLLLLRQGKVSKWFSGIGQEAIAVGATLALDQDEWILPLHRNLGVFTTRQMPLQQLFHQWQGSPLGYSKGRERSFHFGSSAHHIFGMISHLGPQLSVADGIAMALQLEGEGKVALAFTGEGGTSEGEFHEALNVAAVWGLPVIFLVENNGYGLSTPVREQFRCEQLVDKALGYGIRGMRIDGNNILEVYHAVQEAKRHALQEQQPVLIEAMTFRMRGHEEASGTKYVPPALLEYWAQRDPILHFEQFLQYLNLFDASLRESLKQEIDLELQAALHEPVHAFNLDEELADIYAPAPAPLAPTGAVSEKRFIDAIADALQQAMNLHPELILMGQDIAEYGGAFKITEGLVTLYGKERVRNTPLCESAIIGAGLGLSVMGYRSMVEMQFADFVSCGFNQIVNNLAKIHYRWGQNANVVIRLPAGAGVGAGPFHSQSNEAWFTHTPGLKVVYPATPEDAKGLLLAALADPNPVLFFEHKALYRSISGPVPDAPYTIEIGKAKVLLDGDELSIITYGAGVHWALEYAQLHEDVSIHILDLRSLQPLDYQAIREAVAATGKVLILHEATLTGGFGAEIAAWIAQHCFHLLDAPVMRCASLDTPVPFAAELEEHFLARSRLHECVQKLHKY